MDLETNYEMNIQDDNYEMKSRSIDPMTKLKHFQLNFKMTLKTISKKNMEHNPKMNVKTIKLKPRPILRTFKWFLR